MTPIVNQILLALLKETAKRLAAKAAEDYPDVGSFSGKYALYDMGKHGKSKVWEFRNDAVDPLIFTHTSSGYQFRPQNNLGTDGGSIPWVFRGAPRKHLRLDPEDFIEAYILHDAACANGWLWVRNGASGEWAKIKITKRQADVMLAWFLSAPTLAKPGKPSISATRGEVLAIYGAVWAFHSAIKKV